MDFFNSLTTTQKVLLGVSVLALLIVIAVVIYRNTRSNMNKPACMKRSAPESEYVEKQPVYNQQPPPQQQQQPREAALVMFFAPWCGHCKRLEPIWDEFTRNFDGYNGVQIIKVNGDENPDLAQLHNVRGFPTVKFCPRGVRNPEGLVYEGDRSMNSIAEFLQQNA